MTPIIFLPDIPSDNRALTELDVSGNNLGMEGVLVVAGYLDGNRAISSVNILKNGIGSDQAEALVSMLKEHPTLKSLCGNRGDETELDMSGKMGGAGDVVMLAAEVIDNGALFYLDIHDVCDKEALFPVAKVEELDKIIRNNRLRPVLEDSTKSLTELNLHGRFLDAKDAVVVADALRDMGTLTGLNLADNNIGQLAMSDGWQFDEDADEYWKAVEGEELVAKQLPAGEELAIESPVGAIAITNAIKDMRALTSLNLASNSLGVEGAKIVAAFLPRCT
jgi:hypothetical protein